MYRASIGIITFLHTSERGEMGRGQTWGHVLTQSWEVGLQVGALRSYIVSCWDEMLSLDLAFPPWWENPGLRHQGRYWCWGSSVLGDWVTVSSGCHADGKWVLMTKIGGSWAAATFHVVNRFNEEAIWLSGFSPLVGYGSSPEYEPVNVSRWHIWNLRTTIDKEPPSFWSCTQSITSLLSFSSLSIIMCPSLPIVAASSPHIVL